MPETKPFLVAAERLALAVPWIPTKSPSAVHTTFTSTAGVASWFGREPVLLYVEWAEFERLFRSTPR